VGSGSGSTFYALFIRKAFFLCVCVCVTRDGKLICYSVIRNKWLRLGKSFYTAVATDRFLTLYREMNFTWDKSTHRKTVILRGSYQVWFGLAYLFIHSVTHVTLDTSISLQFTYYNTIYNIWTSPQYNIINKNTKF